MRIAVLGLVAVIVVAAVSVGVPPGDCVGAQQPPRQKPPSTQAPLTVMASAGKWMAFCCEAGKGATQVILLDAGKQVISVYHVDSGSGAIELKSVRQVQWDLQLEEFNGTSPLPREIRALLQRQ